ncbi:hypothetical protein F4802DRAFT_269391 [Xylaria palmicola]|nr:hypothetical protein F4802DRAFT_269391 [Xylaria palmicola]
MPLSREPSQRALNWVKRSTSKSSNNASKRAAEPEIVHLGGARVGTAFEVLDLPAPDRSRPTDRPLTQWGINPPPPNPPGIGIAIAIAKPDDSDPNESLNASDADSERPLTQWFPEFIPERATNTNASQNLGSRAADPYVGPKTDTAEDELPSPLSPISSSNVTLNTPATTVSPLRSPITPVDIPEANPPPSSQFPQRSTSLSQASRHAPLRLAKRPVGNDALLRATEVQLRRTQSNAEVPRTVEWRRSPPQPSSERNRGSPPIPEVLPQEVYLRQSRSTINSPLTLNTTQDIQPLPPLTSAPPNGPLPPISAAKSDSHGKAHDQFHRRGRSYSSDRSTEKSPAREHQERAEGQQPRAEKKLTSKERFWLHRHYRGEAMFLNAWGLQITSEEDRKEGRKILRELMEGEVQEERESRERQHAHHRSGSQSRSSTGTTTSGRDGVGLDVIAEERLSREVFFHLAESSTDRTEDKFWKIERGTRDQLPGNQSGPEKHLRNESSDSVLGQYLDLRLSHNN